MKNKIEFSENEKKIAIILLICLAIFAIIFIPYYLKIQREKLYIMTPNYKIKYEKGKWKNITDSDDYKLRKFDIYVDNNFLGNYKVLYSDRFTLIDDNENIVDYNGFIFAAGGNIDIKLYSFNEETNFDDIDYSNVREALNKIDIDSSAYFNIQHKISFDINNDGINEYVYHVDNMGKPSENSLDGIASPVSNNSGYNYSVLFMYKDNEIYIIDKDVTKENDYKVFEPINIVDIKDDGKLELIYIKGERYNAFSDCANIYNLTKHKLVHNFCK